MVQKFITMVSDDLIESHKKALETLEVYSRMHGWLVIVELKVNKQSSVWHVTLTYEKPHQLYWYGRLIERYLSK